MEIWKTIEGFEDYRISDFGNVKSLKYGKEKFLKGSKGSEGYLNVGLYLNGILNMKKVHQLVAIHFKNHAPCGYKLVINHKDFNKLNNNVNNLEIVTARENTNQKHIKSSSQYVGVNWHKQREKWVSGIKINGKRKHLGYFENELDAHKAYQDALFYQQINSTS